jgi:xylulokinase
VSGGGHVLALDLGTSGVKLALIATDGRIAETAVEPYGLTFLPGGGVEQDPDDWWRAIVRGTHAMLDRRTVRRDDVIGVGASAQWSGTVAVDRAGRHLMNAVIWMDSRGAPHVRRVVDGFPKIEGYAAGKLLTWIRRTGGAPGHSGKDPIAHILFIQHERPDVHRETGVYLEPKDWLNLRLTGRAAASFDSITLHWVTDTRDVRAVRYDPRLLGMSGMDPSKLPALIPAASVVGTLTQAAAAELGLRPDVQVASGMGDVVAAAIGSGAVRDFEAHACIGTSSWLICHVPNKKTDLFHNMASLPSGIPGRYVLANEQESAGACLAALKDNVLEIGGYRELFGLAEAIPAGSGGLLFTPWLNGERTPVDDRLIRGGFFNQSLETTRAHMVRAVLEGVAMNTRWLLKYVERFIKRPLDAVNLIGGGARSDLWCQIHADVLGRPIRRVEQPTFAGARGAAFQALVAMGRMSFEDVPSRAPIDATFQPNADHRALYDGLFAEFLNLYKSTRKISARLNGAR